MVFYDSTKTTNGICQAIDRLCDSDDTSFPRLDKTSEVNIALEVIVGELIRTDGTFQYDDDNYTTSPIGTGTLVSGQHKYTFTDKFLQIEEVDMLDVNGYFRRMKPFDASETDLSFEELFGITSSAGVDTAKSGFPMFYDKEGNVIKFNVAPTAAFATLTSGLRVKFKRTAFLFTAVSTTATDTTVPGFDSTYHVILAYMASIPYCIKYKPERVGMYEKKVQELMKGLIDANTSNEKDKRNFATMAPIKFR